MIKSRVRTGHSFIKDSELATNRLESEHIEISMLHMDAPPTVVGFTGNICERFMQHGNHVQSNPILNILEALSRIRFGEKYKVHKFVLYLIGKQDHAAMGEI